MNDCNGHLAKPLQIYILSCLFMGMLGGSAWGAASSEEVLQWVALHNQYRVKHQVEPVVWSQAVAASAQAYADSCPTGHSQSGYGENLAWGYGSMDSVVTAWYSEEQHYDYNNPGFSGDTGHFTQVVWKGTTEIGCALKTGCSEWSRTWVCQYNPPGNYLGRFAQNVFPPVVNPPPPPPPTTPPQAGGTLLIPAIQLLLD